SYEVTADDVIAANLLHLKYSPAARWHRWLVRGIGPAVAASGLIWAIAQDRGHPERTIPHIWIAVPLAVVVGFLAYFACARGMRRGVVNRVRKTLAQGDLQGMTVGTCTMEIAGGRLITRSRLSETTIDLQAIKRIDEFEGYALVYIASNQVLIIPTRNLLPMNDYRDFVAALRHAWESGSVDGIASEHIAERE
ncbi:MAG TPA: YcxB family protein, partial [Gemmataceae bacterium]|nr:YcxB family protein [Gemmataceae bacterium]